MSIQADLETFSVLNEKIKVKRKELAELHKLRGEVETKIKEYLIGRDQPGVIYNGFKILLDERMAHPREKKIDETDRLTRLLQQHGVANPEDVLKELKNPDKVKKTKLVVKKNI